VENFWKIFHIIFFWKNYITTTPQHDTNDNTDTDEDSGEDGENEPLSSLTKQESTSRWKQINPMQFLNFHVSLAQVCLAAVDEEAGDSDESETDKSATGRR